eukprot:SAG31_NODE_262_length_18842_cov_22.033346_15_plen_86_part_00
MCVLGGGTGKTKVIYRKSLQKSFGEWSREGLWSPVGKVPRSRSVDLARQYNLNLDKTGSDQGDLNLLDSIILNLVVQLYSTRIKC